MQKEAIHLTDRSTQETPNNGDDRKPSGYWTDTEAIELAALAFYEEQGWMTQHNLKSKGRSDLWAAIRRYYPGGLKNLRQKLDIPRIKPVIWSPERIRSEVQDFIAQGNRLGPITLERSGKTELSRAIHRKYPGGWSQLRKDLDLKPLVTTWTPELIREEALKFFLAEGRITGRLVVLKGKSGLGFAIQNKYPGGWDQLRKDIGKEVQTISTKQANSDLETLFEE